MSLEATMIVLDNSANSLNGDFPRASRTRDPAAVTSSLTHTLALSAPCCAIASRLQAQSDSVFRIFGAKCRAHPENEVGLMVMGGKGSVVHCLSIAAAIRYNRPAHSRCYHCPPLGRGHAAQLVLDEAKWSWWG